MDDKLFLGIVVFLLVLIYVDKYTKNKTVKKKRYFQIPIEKNDNNKQSSLNDDDNLRQHRQYRGVSDAVDSIQSKWNSDIELNSSAYNSNVERENSQIPLTIRKKNEIVRNEGGWLALDEQHNNTGKVFSSGYDEYLLRM